MKWYKPTDRLPNEGEMVIVAWIGEDGVYSPDCVITASIWDKNGKKWRYDGCGVGTIHDTDRWMYPPLPED